LKAQKLHNKLKDFEKVVEHTRKQTNKHMSYEIKTTFSFYTFWKLANDMNSFLVSCSQFATQLEEAIKEQSDVCIMYKLISIKYKTCIDC
jgi:16S rRNA U1498 N3-methylase RsmE